MGFAGELTTIGLPEVFQNVAFNRLTGSLTVSERDRRAVIYFEGGLIRAFSDGSERTFDYGAIAVRCGAVPAEPVEKARRRLRRRTVLAVFKNTEEFDVARYEQGLAHAIEEQVILLFEWKDASFLFEEGRPDEGGFDKDQLECSLAIDQQAVTMEAARRLDEWVNIGRHIGSEREIFVAPSDHGTEVTPEVAELLALLDGTRDLRAIIDELPHARFEVMKTVASLMEQGLVTRASAEDLRDLARRAQAAAEVHRATRYLEAALERESGDLEARHDLVRLYERAGRKSDAVKEYKRLAFAQSERGDLDSALESFERAAALVPYDTDTLERIVKIHDARGDRPGHLKAGRRLAEALSSQGLHEEALEVYQRMVELDGDNVSLREALASIHIKLHEPKRAAHELLALARRSWSQADFDRSLHYYRNVMAVDRECAEASERIEEIESGRAREQRRHKRRRVVFVALSLVLGLGGWQMAREWYAKEGLLAAGQASVGALAQDPADRSLIESIGHFARVCESFPFTKGSAQAEEMVRMLLLDELHRVHIAVVTKPKAAEKLVRALARVRYPDGVQDFWKSSRDHLLREIAKRRAKASARR